MGNLSTLADGVRDLVSDGDSVALEGFTHLIPFAAGHELIRQERRDLELIRMTPDVLYDQLVGVGPARKLVFSYAGNPGVGSLHRPCRAHPGPPDRLPVHRRGAGRGAGAAARRGDRPRPGSRP